jgi:Ser-tRNA(Ala) deacylase AlaX
VILDRTGFYPAGGGQPADTGIMKGEGGEIEVADVRWTGRQVSHITSGFKGEIREGEQVRGVIDWDRRYALMRNHTAAHVMGEAVRRATGVSSEIVGSAIDLDKARLDFAYNKSLRQLFPKIEEIANEVVKENRIVEVKMMKRQEAEDYVERFSESLKTLPSQVQHVRIVEIKDWHACACGGTHVKSTRELEFIKVLRRASKGKGVERLEFSAKVL